MDPSEAADTITEAAEEGEGEARFRRHTAIFIGVLAMLLAITGLGGDNATTELVNANILATDTWAFYQARNIRQTSTQLAADELDLMLKSNPALPTELRAEAERRLEAYRADVAYFESDPVERGGRGEGKAELTMKARAYEAARDHAQAQDDNFDYAEAFFQIAIVLASVSIVALSRLLLGLSAVLGLTATFLMINGFLLLVPLPF
jgi:hypothetical protein